MLKIGFVESRERLYLVIYFLEICREIAAMVVSISRWWSWIVFVDAVLICWLRWMSRENSNLATCFCFSMQNIEKLKKVVEESNYYGAQQMYKSISARYEYCLNIYTYMCIYKHTYQIFIWAKYNFFVAYLSKPKHSCYEQKNIVAMNFLPRKLNSKLYPFDVPHMSFFS